MTEQVIDSLVVTLGLNSKMFQEGLKTSTVDLQSFATKTLGLIGLGVGIDKIVGYFKELHHQLAEVGYESRNLGVSGTEISKWGEVAQLAGGRASDAAANIEGFQSSIFNLRFNGQMSDNLAMLQRFGVAYLTASGHMRNFRDFAMDAAHAIDRQAQAGNLGAGERMQLAQHFGFSGGIAAAVANGGKNLEKALQQATKDQKPLNERIIDGQVKLAQALTRNSAAQDATNATMLSTVTPAVQKLSDLMTKLDTDLVPLLTKLAEVLVNVIGPTLTAIANSLSYWFKDHSQEQIQQAKKSPLVQPDFFQRILGRALVYQYNSGVGQQYRAPTDILSRVQAWTGDALTTFRALNDIHDKIGVGRDMDWSRAIDQYNRQIVSGATHPEASTATPQAPSGVAHGVIPRTLMTSPGTAAAPVTPPTAMNGGTTVTFQNVTVNSRGQDGQTLARDFVDGTQRRYLVTNSDGGVA